MKMHLVVLLLLVVSLVALQGCSGGGTWFPSSHRPVNTQNYWDWNSTSHWGHRSFRHHALNHENHAHHNHHHH